MDGRPNRRNKASFLGQIRDLKHRRRRAERTTTGSKISPYCATAHARLVVYMKSGVRTSGVLTICQNNPVGTSVG